MWTAGFRYSWRKLRQQHKTELDEEKWSFMLLVSSNHGCVKLCSDASVCFMVLLHDWSRHEALHASLHNSLRVGPVPGIGPGWSNVASVQPRNIFWTGLGPYAAFAHDM